MSNFVFVFIAVFIGFFLLFALVVSMLIFVHSLFCIILNASEIGIG